MLISQQTPLAVIRRDRKIIKRSIGHAAGFSVVATWEERGLGEAWRMLHSQPWCNYFMHLTAQTRLWVSVRMELVSDPVHRKANRLSYADVGLGVS